MKVFNALLGGFAVAAARCVPRGNPDYSNFTVALVRAPPVNMPYPPPESDWYKQMHDINATVDFGVKLIQRAAMSGADFVAFPELWFPGYIDSVPGPNEMLSNYLENGIVVGDTNWQKLVAAARDNSVWLELGFEQRIGDHVYMGQALINSEGQEVQVRQKLRPSGGERSIFSDGTIDQLQVHATPFGRIGMLNCWEHMHPTMTFAVQAQYEHLHIAAFPWAPDWGVDTGVTRSEVSLAGARYYAVTGGTWVFMPAVGTAAVIAPNGTVVASIEASDCPYTEPLLYYSLNATQFSERNHTYSVDGEFSWAALQQMNAQYPAYIPQVEGNMIPRRFNSVAQMKESGPIPLNYEFI